MAKIYLKYYLLTTKGYHSIVREHGVDLLHLGGEPV